MCAAAGPDDKESAWSDGKVAATDRGVWDVPEFLLIIAFPALGAGWLAHLLISCADLELTRSK